MAMWGKRRIAGVEYDLTHLDPFLLTIPGFRGAADVTARVRFGSHVFTIKWDDNYIDEHKITDGGKPRCFCPERFGHSVHLKTILETGCPGRVLFDPARKLVMLGNPPRSVQPYAVFFEMQAARRRAYDLDLVIVSAHTQPQLKAKVGMELPHLARLVADGDPIPWPKKK